MEWYPETEAEKTQDKDEIMTDNDISRIERMTPQIARYVCYDGSNKPASRVAEDKHQFRRDITAAIQLINLAETSIFVGRNVHILSMKLGTFRPKNLPETNLG